jgi:hypothetical protein
MIPGVAALAVYFGSSVQLITTLGVVNNESNECSNQTWEAITVDGADCRFSKVSCGFMKHLESDAIVIVNGF